MYVRLLLSSLCVESWSVVGVGSKSGVDGLGDEALLSESVEEGLSDMVVCEFEFIGRAGFVVGNTGAVCGGWDVLLSVVIVRSEALAAGTETVLLSF
jgi:hypothetical protein